MAEIKNDAAAVKPPSDVSDFPPQFSSLQSLRPGTSPASMFQTSQRLLNSAPEVNPSITTDRRHAEPAAQIYSAAAPSCFVLPENVSLRPITKIGAFFPLK